MTKQSCFEAKSVFRGHIAGSPPEWKLDKGELGDQISAQISSQMRRSVLRSVHRCSDNFTDAHISADAQIKVCEGVSVCVGVDVCVV
jgi:hypothetical protein